MREKSVPQRAKQPSRQIPVETYSRVVGYYRPVSQWNPGKRAEFSERIPLKIAISAS